MKGDCISLAKPTPALIVDPNSPLCPLLPSVSVTNICIEFPAFAAVSMKPSDSPGRLQRSEFASQSSVDQRAQDPAIGEAGRREGTDHRPPRVETEISKTLRSVQVVSRTG